ncbi:hypothetical protein PR048_018146 [Dryococelus australis]|uniref:Uncharacterized protein n=1 Tax=Dryococelus australis TaxID=614101 RepID=A0ABQ9HBL2_9NEOP|nr:hypothetical protein PR048_018146 [Dryococelus australis]
MASVDYKATTSDCWSRGKKSFLGVTAYWINNKTLDKESCALVCKHIRGHHTYNSISGTYTIQNKVVCTTTDSASDFVNFGIPCENENTKEGEEHNAEAINLMEIFDESDNNKFRRHYRWSKQNQSILVAEWIEDLCGEYFKIPNKAMWGSTYDSLQQLTYIHIIKKPRKCRQYHGILLFAEIFSSRE